MTVEAVLPLRGARDYLHSTSILNFWAARRPGAGRYELVLHRRLARALRFTRLAPGSAPAGAGHVAITEGGRRELWQIDEVGETATAREPYDEALVPVEIERKARLCRVGEVPGFTLFDRLVPANKALIEALHRPAGRLVAAKIVVDGLVAGPWTIRLGAQIGGRVFLSHVEAGGRPTGEMVYHAA